MAVTHLHPPASVKRCVIVQLFNSLTFTVEFFRSYQYFQSISIKRIIDLTDSVLSGRIVLGLSSCDKLRLNHILIAQTIAGLGRRCLFIFLPRLTAARNGGEAQGQNEQWPEALMREAHKHHTFSCWSPGAVCAQQMWFALLVWTHVLYFCWGYFPRFPQEGPGGL